VHRTAPLPRRPRRRAAALLVAGALVALSACGGSDDGGDDAAASSSASAPATSSAAEDTGSSSSAPAEEGGTLTVTGVDFDFELDSTDLSAGEYEVTFANEGGATHNVVVEQDGEDVGASDTIGPGESTTFTVALEPGEYVFYCGVGNHRAMGMETTVTVT
jgi:plastocyanin